MMKPIDYQKKAERFDTLCRNVLSSGEGREFLLVLKERFAECKLYQETDRATIYAVAQRDLILELEDRIKSQNLTNGIPSGEEVS